MKPKSTKAAKCPECKSKAMIVIRSWDKNGVRYRIRQCDTCGAKRRTAEPIDGVVLATGFTDD